MRSSGSRPSAPGRAAPATSGAATAVPGAADAGRPRGRALVAHVTPNWFAAVMGTGVVSVAASSLPVPAAVAPALGVVALGAWALAAALLVLLAVATALHWHLHRETALAHARHPVTATFYGAPAMALLTVGAGTHLVGQQVVGAGPALVAFAVLWTSGTLLGVATAVVVPFRTAVGAGLAPGGGALPAWMMPVVPPMVSASTGALLVPHVPAGQARLTLLLVLVALFGLSLVAGLMTATLVHGRLLGAGPLPVQAAPTVVITLGVVGQSVTAAHLLAGATASTLGAGTPAAEVTAVLAVVYGAAMTGFGGLLLGLAALLVAHAARRGLRFSLTWWSFTFPVGTCVTGASGLAAATGAVAVEGLAVALFALLLVAWAVVATGTARGTADGRLLRAA